MTGMWGTVGAPRHYSTEQMVSAVVEAGGNLTAAAAALGCDVETLRRRRAREPELARAISLLKSRAAKATWKRRQRRERARARGREALEAGRSLRSAPGVEVVYLNEEAGLVLREVDDQEAEATTTVVAPAAPGRRHPDLPWTAPSWVLVRILAPAADKHHGPLAIGDVLRVPATVAGSWARSGIATLEAE